MIVDATNSTWGLNVFDRLTQSFRSITPWVITDPINITDNFYPVQSLGNTGDYAVIPYKPIHGYMSRATYFYKTTNGWVIAGSPSWKKSIPTVIGNRTPIELPEDSSFRITLNKDVDLDVIVPKSPNNTIQGICDFINSRKISNLIAYIENGRLAIVFAECGKFKYFVLSHNNSSLLSLLGLAPGKYFIPEMVYSVEPPPWKHDEEKPHPSDSLWVNLNDGLNIKAYDNNIPKKVYSGISEGDVAKQLDHTGGTNIPIGALFAKVNPEGNTTYGGIVLFERVKNGSTIVKNSFKNPNISKGKQLTVTVTMPNEVRVFHDHRIFTTTGITLESFVNDWTTANVPNTTAEVVDGYLQLTHVLGGDIFMVDLEHGQSNGLLNELGFIPYQTEHVRYGPCYTFTNSNVAQSWTSGSGQGVVVEVSTKSNAFIPSHVVEPGFDYKVGDIIHIQGTELAGDSNTHDLEITVQNVDSKGGVTQFALYSGVARVNYSTVLSYWKEIDYSVQ